MTVKEFLLKERGLINLSEVAKLMWPNNKTARVYLDKKLHDRRPWTDKDAAMAKSVLKQLAVDITALD